MKSHGDHIGHAASELERQHPHKHGHVGVHHMEGKEHPVHSSHEHGTYKPKHHAGRGMAGHMPEAHESKRVDQEIRGHAGKGDMAKHEGEPRGRHQDESGISEGEQSGTMKRLKRMP